MNTTIAKPVPRPIATTQPYWDGLRQHKVFIQYSPSTRRWVFYPRVLAPGSLAADLEWREVAGTGTLYTFTVARYPTAPAWKDDVPQLLGVVQLDEGPRMTTELVNVAPEALVVGMRVRPVFCDDPATGITMLKFEPAGG
ncbi:Zn-ribbon domain-containing OB-fold protein [Rhodanobacter lindaniclasticus]